MSITYVGVTIEVNIEVLNLKKKNNPLDVVSLPRNTSSHFCLFLEKTFGNLYFQEHTSFPITVICSAGKKN